MTKTLTYTTGAHADSSGFLGRLRKSYADYRLYRRTLNELHGLSNRELNDLGLSSFSLRQVAYDSVYGA